MGYKFITKNIYLTLGISAVLIIGFIFLDWEKDVTKKVAEDVKNACTGSNLQKRQTSKETCYYQEFIKIGEEKGSEEAFETLFALQKIDQSAQGCHLMAHGIGTGSYRNDPDNWQELIRNISSACSYGGPHGVIEEYLQDSGQKMTKEFIPQICGSEPRADCNHIVGHLILVETEADINKAIDLCGVFTDNYQREFCLTGVFMEYQTALNLIVHGYAPESWRNWPARVPELEKTCRSYDGENAVACWKEISHAVIAKFRGEPQKVFDFCNSAQAVEAALECKHHSIGIMAASHRFDLENLKSMCLIPQKNEPDFEGQCYIQLAASTLSTIPDAKDKVEAFCRGLSDEYRNDCLNRLPTLIQTPLND